MNIDVMNEKIDVSYIKGYLAAFSGMNTVDNHNFRMELTEINSIYYPYKAGVKVNPEKIEDWEEHTITILEKWLFMSFDQEEIDLKNFTLSQNRKLTAKAVVDLIGKVVEPIDVYLENKIDTHDCVWDSIIFKGKNKNYLLYFSWTD